ncbi:MAG: cyclic nucleotide-binding domain-containing protein [Acidobacteria bacterium]|nr:cyclic nucleotide-binding domain-containing protein [Acidobacteriota bacterium]
MKFDIRVVETEAERDKLYRFRYRIYVDEEKFTRNADHAQNWLKDDYDDVATSFAIFDGDEVVGSLRLLFMDSVADLQPFIEKFRMAQALDAFGASAICTTSRFMVDPILRNGKLIFKLMRNAYVHCLQRGARLNFGDCSPHLIPFYEHMGYRRYTTGFNDSSFGYKIPILMLFRDHQFLSSVRSLLLRMAEQEADDQEARSWFEQTYPDYKDVRSAVFMEDAAFLDLLNERLAMDPVHHLSLLHDLEPQEAERFLSEATIFPVKPGDSIIRRGDVDASVFVQLKGLAHVLGEGSAPLAIVGAGDTFGEIGFLTASPRTAHVMAQTPGEVLVLRAEFLNRFIKREPTIAAKILLNLAREMAARLALTTQELMPNHRP